MPGYKPDGINLAEDYWRRNLCDDCRFHPANCDGRDQVFGDAAGNDNVVECDAFRTAERGFWDMGIADTLRILAMLAIVALIVIGGILYEVGKFAAVWRYALGGN